MFVFFSSLNVSVAQVTPYIRAFEEDGVWVVERVREMKLRMIYSCSNILS